ncbi:MAG TPA: hypothetical protein VHZ26_14785 [Caulobacteraceae bacterium]|jgi:hypothetical protein|nr:hypothetical protein [Caulobacteraceae bacterium]
MRAWLKALLTLLAALSASLAFSPVPAQSQQVSGAVFDSTAQSVSVAAGGTFQQVLAYSATRHGCFVQNTNASDTIWVFFQNPVTTPTPIKGASVVLSPGQGVNCNSGVIVADDAIWITGSNTSDTATVISQ